MALLSYIITTLLTNMYYSVLYFAMFGGSAWRLIYISVQYNGGLLPDIILLTQDYYYHRGIRLNTMQWLCLYSILYVTVYY